MGLTQMVKSFSSLLTSRRVGRQLRLVCTTGPWGKPSRAVIQTAARLVTSRVIPILAAGLVLSSCFGEGGDQVHGMINVAFPSTAVCQAQQKLISFRNVSGGELVIEGVAMSVGTDPMANFSLQGIRIGSAEQESINGVLQDVHIPSGESYAFVVAYVPKTENSNHEAILDIAYREPKEGIVQVSLRGNSAGTVGDCSGGGGGGGPVGFDGPMILTVDSLVAATSAIGQPITTNQGVNKFEAVPIPLVLDSVGGTVDLDPFNGDTFVLPKPRPEVPLLGNLMRGSITVTIPDGGSGTYDPATGSVEMPHIRVVMDGPEDFYAELDITLTTGRISVATAAFPINVSAWPFFGTPSHYSPTTQEVFGTPIDPETGKLFLVGITEPQSVVVRGATEFNGLPNSSMAVLMEGTLTEAP